MSDPAGKVSGAPSQAVESASADAGPSRARRRLILGAGAALPSVYTLTSGAQTAAASVLHCTVANPPSNLQRFTLADDQWYRNKTYAGKQGFDPAYCVSSGSLSCTDALHP